MVTWFWRPVYYNAHGCGKISKSSGARCVGNGSGNILAWSDRPSCAPALCTEMLQFGFGHPGQPREPIAMFGSEILSREKLPAMFDDSSLALGQKKSDTWGKYLKGGGLLLKTEAGR